MDDAAAVGDRAGGAHGAVARGNITDPPRRLSQPDMWIALALSLVLIAYNNVINRWGPFHGAAYVPLNLAFAGAVTVTAAATLGLTRDELGLQGKLSDTWVPVILVNIFAVGAFALAGSRHAHRIADKRVRHLRGRALAFYTLVRIPLGTAVAEEVVFRGVLFAAWLDAGFSMVPAALCASIAFGFWHVTPTILGVRISACCLRPQRCAGRACRTRTPACPW